MSRAPFAEWLSSTMPGFGFHRPGSSRLTWAIEEDGNVGLLAFYSRSMGRPGAVSVTASLAVASRRLAAVFGEPPPEPDAMSHPWYRGSIYIHHQTPDKVENTWRFLDVADPNRVARAEADLRDRIVPALREHLTDDGLRRCWRTFDDPWRGPLTTWTYVAVLDRELGTAEEQAASMERLRALLADANDDLFDADRAAPGLRALGLPY